MTADRPASLQVTVSGSGTTRVVAPAGECDLATAPRLAEAVALLRPPEVRTVVVDASRLDFIDSSGISVLITAYRRLSEAGGKLAVAGAHGSVRRVIELTGLRQVMPVYDDVQSALATGG